MTLFVALEGIDGAGKGTQTAALAERVQQAGYRCAVWSFPRYHHTRFGQQVQRFLHGEFGTLEQVHPLLVSLLFAGDRWESRRGLIEALFTHDVVLCDRYVASNQAHQAAKLQGEERQQLLAWIGWLEYELYVLPRPHLVLWFDLPIDQAQQMLRQRAERQTHRPCDLQEQDREYLQRVREVYADLAQRDPSWHRVSVVDDQHQLRTRSQITEEIWGIVAARLAAQTASD
ncbi:MAG: thymidylate kinase [Planctomycetaceae bacterium]|nr:MAG: thymidylate kinase [Planctomycetaceae bacterium]